MKNAVLIFLSSLVLTLGSCSSPAGDASTVTDEIVTPESQGISSNAILAFIDALEAEHPDAIHSIILRRHGKIVAQGWWEPFNPESPHMLYSLSKSFTSTAIGMAQDEGLLSVNDPVLSFFPDEGPEEPGKNLESMRIRDLLRMNTGHEKGTMGRMREGETWAAGFLALDVEHKPGTHFLYNTGASYMLSAILQKAAGVSLMEFLEPRLFEPLGIENPTWESDPQGINTGGYGLSVTSGDISRFGQLYLQEGMWNGKQLLSPEWVKEATSFQTSNGSNPENDWEQGYGYQFWRCRYDNYRGDGAFGQFCIVMPEMDAVLAITSGCNDMQGILDLVWEHVLTAMKANALPGDEAACNKMTSRLHELAISRVEGRESSSLAEKLRGRVFRLEPGDMGIESIRFDMVSFPGKLTVTAGGLEQSFQVGYDSYEKGILRYPDLVSDKIASCGAWQTPEKMVINTIYYETPHAIIHTISFSDDGLLWERELNVGFGRKKLEPLRGHAE